MLAKKIQKTVRGLQGRKKAQAVQRQREQRRQQSAPQVSILPDIEPAPLGTTAPPPPPPSPASASRSVQPSVSRRQAPPPPQQQQQQQQQQDFVEQLREGKSKLRKTLKQSKSKPPRALTRKQRDRMGRLSRKTRSSLTEEEKEQLDNYTRRYRAYTKAVRDSREKRSARRTRRQQKDRTMKIEREKEQKKAALAAQTKAVMRRLPASGRVHRPVVIPGPVAESDKWLKVTDPTTSRSYWHNSRTGESSWTSPASKVSVPAKGLSEEVLRQKIEREQDEKQLHDRAPTASGGADDSGLLSHDIDHQYQLLQNYIEGIREAIVEVKMPAGTGTVSEADLKRRRQAYLTFLRDAGLGNFEQLVGTQALVGVKSSKAATRVYKMRLRLIDITALVSRHKRLDLADEDPGSAGGGGGRERLSDHALRQRPEYEEEATQAFCGLFSTTANPKPNTFNMEKLCSIVKLTQAEANRIHQQRAPPAVPGPSDHKTVARAADATARAAEAALVAHRRQRGHLERAGEVGDDLAELQKRLASERRKFGETQKLEGGVHCGEKG